MDPKLHECVDYHHIFERMLDPIGGLQTGSRTWMLLTVDNAFKGSELLDWLIQTGFSSTKPHAKEIATYFLSRSLISHCSSDSLPFTSACFYQFTQKNTGWEVPLLFIHGIKGSVLADAQTKKVAWITASQALSQKKVSGLQLPLQWKNGKQAKDNLIPIEILKEVKVAGFGEDVYGSWIKTMRSLKRLTVIEFVYDWRRSLFEAVDSLIQTLEATKKRTGKKVQVVAHSMGGLVTHVAMSRRPDLFHSVLFAGVPFEPGVGFIEDIHGPQQDQIRQS